MFNKIIILEILEGFIYIVTVVHMVMSNSSAAYYDSDNKLTITKQLIFCKY